MRDDRIEHLIRLLEKSQLQELELSEGWGRRLRLSKAGATPAPMPVSQSLSQAEPAAQPAPAAAAPEAGPGEDPNLIKVVAPMVGTFYSAPSPDAAPYVQVGSDVTPGQTLCIIEAMKIMNEIACEVKGSIRKILVENAQPVEFGQTLFLVQRSS